MQLSTSYRLLIILSSLTKAKKHLSFVALKDSISFLFSAIKKIFRGKCLCVLC